MKYIILLLITSCAQQPLRERIISSHRVETYQVGIKCPNEYYYNPSDNICYPINRPLNLITRQIKVIVRGKVVKPLRMSKIDCSNVFKVINQCSGVR